MSDPRREARIRGYKASGWWPDLTFHELLRRNANAFPAREALVDAPDREHFTTGSPQRLTWKELDDRVALAACRFVELGFGKGDVIVIQMPNVAELLVTYFACFRLGLIACPVPPQYREHELGHIVRLTRAKGLATADRIGQHLHAAMAVALKQTLPTLQRVMVFGATSLAGVDRLDGGTAAAPDAALLDRYALRHTVGPDDIATICWTSGSEGQPKGIARSHNQWLAFACSFDKYVDEGARLLNARPLVTHGAFIGSIIPWVMKAGALVQHHPFKLTSFLEQLDNEKITFTAIAPAILSMLLAQPELAEGRDFSHLKYVSSGSAPLGAALMKGLHEKFRFSVLNVFGSTEGAMLVSSPDTVPDPAVRADCFPRFGAHPFAWPDAIAGLMETRLVDPATGETIERPGCAGELRYRGALVFDGYYNASELNHAAFDADGFYRSGDLFEITGDRNQFYRFSGRAKDVIVRGGYNISALEIENLLLTHPDIVEAAVIGYPDDKLGERICAVAITRAGTVITLDEIVRFLRAEKKVAVIKLPERLVLVDGFPRGPAGKILKAELKKTLRMAT